MIRLTYLLVDLCAVIIPFIFSFHPKLQFHKKWKALFPSLLITGTIFIIWDIIFTNAGIWQFNEKYVTGFYFFSIPIEEILFFLCIPYSCLFTYHCFKIFFENKLNGRAFYLSSALIIVLVFTAIKYPLQFYTSITFSGLAILLFINTIIIKAEWMKLFFITYFVLLIPFFICNGILTGTGPDEPVVIYNDSYNLGVRLITIPVEDVFYGMLLVLMNTSIYEYFLRKN